MTDTPTKVSSLTEMVRPGQNVTFQFYRERELWYRTDTGFEFPVPISDAGTAVFNAHDHAILFMRWIRKHIKMLEEARRAES